MQVKYIVDIEFLSKSKLRWVMEACEDALYDIVAFRDFCRIDLGREGVPDAASLPGFRHLLEEHKPGAAMFAKIGELLQANGLRLSGGTIVDATIIAAQSSMKNVGRARDPEMHQTKKGNRWYFVRFAHSAARNLGFAEVLRRLRLLVA